MKHTRIYIVLQTALLLSISLSVHNGWTETEWDVLSFLSKKDKDSPIILMNTGGATLERLATDPGVPSEFTWSPSGRSIAYESWHGGNLDIYVMDVGTNEHRQLTFDGNKDRFPVWSPNGKWIAFVSDRAGREGIYRMDADGENVKQLTKQVKCLNPAWSPDSRSIAFVSHGTLFVIDTEAGNVRQIVKANSVFFDCTWSPDGKQIAFITAGLEDGIVIYRIDVIDVDRQNTRQLTKAEEGTDIWELAWSPSGKWIAYILTQKNGHIAQQFANGIVRIVNTAADGQDEPIEATKGMGAQYISWVPTASLPVSSSVEKQKTLWGKLKQTETASK